MLDAKILATSTADDSSGGRPIVVWGVWIPRKGDNLILPVEIVFNFGVDLAVDLYHKDYADPGDGNAASASVTFDEITGRQNMIKLGCKELVRVRLTLDRGNELEESQVGILLYRFLQPTWFEAVKV
jgi:hypothetical protein